MRTVFFVGLLLLVCRGVSAQTITVSNFLHPDAPVSRESFAAIDGPNLTDVQLVEPFFPPTTLGGVSVTVDGVAQRIRSVSPTRVVIIVDAPGPSQRSLELRTKNNVIHRTGLRLATYWPSVFVQSTGEDSEAFYPSGLWTTDGITLRPLTSAAIPVGPANRPTLVVIQGSGWRLNSTIVQVRLNGNPCVVVAARPSALFAGQDELVFQVPHYLAGRGVFDLTVSVAGRESNFARINLGDAASFSAR
jgi:uncharacterized protein (TIGR03437 family)